MGTCPSMGTSIRVRVSTHILKNQNKIGLKKDDGPAVENEPVTMEDYTLRTNNRYSILNNEEALITYKEYINELEEKNAERQPKYRHYKSKNKKERYKDMNKKKHDKWEIYLQNV